MSDPPTDVRSLPPLPRLPPLLSRPPRRVALVSYRLGGSDGVSVEAAKWGRAFTRLGVEVTTIAGAGRADAIVPGLAAASLSSATPPSPSAGRDRLESLVETLDGMLSPFDLVVVENVLSLPLNPTAGRALGRVLAGRPALMRHHDLASQRAQYRREALRWPPDDPYWRHVTINERSRLELSARGIQATTVYNRFDPDPPAGDRVATRSALGFGETERVVLQPTRAIRRKNVPGGLLLAAALGATYWLLGAAEDQYGPELEQVLSRAQCRVVRGVPESAATPLSIEDAYAACDAVVLPSTWEGFGNPAIESALHRRPLAISDYPVAFELRRYGFSWFDVRQPARLARFLQAPDEVLLDRNQYVARTRFSTDDLPAVLRELLTGG